MDQRVEVHDAEIGAVFTALGEELKRRLNQHGKNSLIGPHEILGVLDEEMTEFREAVRGNDSSRVKAELLDIAVGCLFGVASVIANERASQAKKA